MYIYAQLNDENIVMAVSQLSGEVDAPNMIQIDSFDYNLLGKRYNVKTREFEEVLQQQPEPESPEPTEQEIVNAELLLGQAQIMESNAAIEETAAIILLEIVGGGANDF